MQQSTNEASLQRLTDTFGNLMWRRSWIKFSGSTSQCFGESGDWGGERPALNSGYNYLQSTYACSNIIGKYLHQKGWESSTTEMLRQSHKYCCMWKENILKVACYKSLTSYILHGIWGRHHYEKVAIIIIVLSLDGILQVDVQEKVYNMQQKILIESQCAGTSSYRDIRNYRVHHSPSTPQVCVSLQTN